MKKKKIILAVVIIVAVLIGVGTYFYLGHTDFQLSYLNKVKNGTNVSNVQCEYEVSQEVNLSSGKYSIEDDKTGIYRAYHPAAAYGLYTYTFDMTVNDQIISPRIAVFKTKWYEHYDVDIEIVIGAPDEDVVYITVTVNGTERINKSYSDTEYNDIYIQVGP